MNMIVHIFYCSCSLNLNEMSSNANNCIENFILDENSFSDTNNQIVDLYGDKQKINNYSHLNNRQCLIRSALNKTNKVCADLIPNMCDDIKGRFENNSDQYKNIFHDHQKINLIENIKLKNTDNKIDTDDQQYFNIEISPNFEISNIFFSEENAIVENKQLKRKLQKAEHSISSNTQQFLERDIKKQKNHTDELVLEKNTYDKDDNSSLHNISFTNIDYLNKLRIDEVKTFKSDLKVESTKIKQTNNVYNIENNMTVPGATLLDLLKNSKDKKFQQNEVENTFTNIKNSITIYDVDELNILYDKINLMGSISGDYGYTVFIECFNIIQQDLLSTLRNAFIVKYEESRFINEQIRKLEYLKININMISRVKDTIHICQELLTFKIKNFPQKLNFDEEEFLTRKSVEDFLKYINIEKNTWVSFYDRLNYLQNSLKNKSCNKISHFKQIIETIKTTRNNAFKYIFLAGMNSLLDKNNSVSEMKNRKILVLLFLYEQENGRFDINWEENLFKILFFRGNNFEFNKDMWELIKRYDCRIDYQGYIYMNYGPFNISNFLLGNSSENFTFNKYTKLLIELVTRIKCRLYNIPY